jgi:hypothetical protein
MTLKTQQSAHQMKRHQLIQYIRQFATTGIIHDAIIPFFDQNGRWRGDTVSWKEQAPTALQSLIKNAHLPESRRSTISRMGPVLMTSWVAEEQEAVTVKYAEIRGSFIAYSRKPVSALGLRYIGGHLSTTTDMRIDVPNLVHVGGNCEVSSSFKLVAPRMRTVGGRLKVSGDLPPRLESVGGSLSTFWLFDFHAPHLKHVGGTLIPHKAETVDVPVLETIGGGFLACETTKRINAPKLCAIGDDFLASHTSDIRAHRLRDVGGDMDTYSAKQFYHPAIRVGGSWTCDPVAVHDWVIREKARQAMRHHGDLPEL